MENNTDHLIISTRDTVTETVAINSAKDTISIVWYMLFATSLVLISLSFVIFAQQKITLAENGAYASAIIATNEKITLTKMKEKKALFETLEIEAQSAVVYDITTNKKLYERNITMRMPLASVTKIMTALVVVEYLSDDDIVTITPNDLATEGTSGFYINEKWKMRDLLNFSLLTSSNDGMTALARTAGEKIMDEEDADTSMTPLELFVDIMNTKTTELELNNTIFYNPTGLDLDTETGGAYSTSEDIVLLLKYIYKNYPSLLSVTQQKVSEIQSENSFLHTATNTNEHVVELPGILASKTGFTDLAGGNLVIMYDSGIGTPVIVVVLGSSFDGRFSDAEQLIWTSLSSFSI